MPRSRRNPHPAIYRVAGSMDCMTFAEFKESINNGAIPPNAVVYRYDYAKRGKISEVPSTNNAVWSE
jgi:hypothetical protein